MIRLSKLADYGIVLLTYFAQAHAQEHAEGRTARELAALSSLPLPTVSKILKALCRGGLLVSQRGMRGGYSLSRPPRAITVVDIIAAIEGPIAMTQCSFSAPGLCEFESACPVRSNWQRINQVVVAALGNLTLIDMQRPAPRGIQTQGHYSGAALRPQAPDRKAFAAPVLTLAQRK